MKKLLISFLLSFFCIMSYGQNNMTFKGYDLNCTVQQLSNKLVNEGYEIKSNLLPNMYSLKGTFAGESAEIAVYGDFQTNVVSTIIVEFEQKSSWESLEKEYLNFKKSLNKKYNEGESVEIFKEPYSKGDGKEMTALNTQNCTYTTKYKFDNGFIVLSISKKGTVQLFYFINSQKSKEQQRNNDL